MKRSSDKPLSEPLTRALLRDLANMRDDGLGRFRRRWDSLYGRFRDEDLLRWRDELRLVWALPFCRIPPSKIHQASAWENAIPLQETKRNVPILEVAREHFPGDPEEKVIIEHWLREAKSPWVVEWSRKRRIRANPRSLPAVLALGCVVHANRFGICRSPECPAPYFFVVRSDQRYCSTACAWPAKKEAKLKWWRKHRGKTARKDPLKKG